MIAVTRIWQKAVEPVDGVIESVNILPIPICRIGVVNDAVLEDDHYDSVADFVASILKCFAKEIA